MSKLMFRAITYFPLLSFSQTWSFLWKLKSLFTERFLKRDIKPNNVCEPENKEDKQCEHRYSFFTIYSFLSLHIDVCSL